MELLTLCVVPGPGIMYYVLLQKPTTTKKQSWATLFMMMESSFLVVHTIYSIYTMFIVCKTTNEQKKIGIK